MLQKKFLPIFLLAAVAQIHASDSKEKYSHETSDLLKEKHFYNSGKSHEKWQKKWHDNADIEKKHKFKEDYERWNEKSNIKNYPDDSNSEKLNEIDSEEFIDKYNKYGKTFKPEYVDNKIRKEKNKYKKNFSYDDKHSAYNSDSKNLLHDVNVNYITEKKKINEDSEIITKAPVNLYKNKENYEQNYQNENQMYLKRHKKDFYQTLKKIDLSQPPKNDTILMARYIVHTVDWAVLGTISRRSPTKGAPFVCVKAISDGLPDSSTGVPFFYMSPLDICTQDLQEDNRVSVLVTLSETEYCKNNNLDPQDPRCAKMTLSGKIKKIKPGSDEEKLAKNALFTKHPSMATWPNDHNWYFAKLKIGQIVLLDKFGGASYIKVKDYLNGGVVEEPEK